MILQALNDYYLRRQRSPDPRDRLPAAGLEEKEIAFIIEIDQDGQLVNLMDTRVTEGKKKIGRRFLVPQGAKKTSGIASNLLWDNAEYVLGLPDSKKSEAKRIGGTGKEAEYLARLGEMKAEFRKMIVSLCVETPGDAGVQAVLAFLDNIELPKFESLPLWSEVIASNPLMTFRLHGDVELVCQRPAVVAAMAEATAISAADGICLIRGTAAATERLHPAIKNVWGAQTAGANIVSFNLDAFNSYGKVQGLNAPFGKPAVFAYTTALNHLLARGSRQRLQIGDTSTVFWAEEAHELETALPDLFGEPPKDDPGRDTEALKALYQAVQSGKFIHGSADARFHVLGLSPNAARIAVRFWQTAPAHELARRIAAHFDDIRIARAPHEPEHLSLFRLFAGLAVQGKSDNIPPNLSGDVMRAILEGMPYPAALLNLAIQRIRAEQKPTYARAAAIKAYLNRMIRRTNAAVPHPEKEFQTMLDPANANPAYLLGRLFAGLEKIQEEASPGLNATIRDRYYSAASSTPVAVFATLLRLKNHHQGKLHKGRAVQLEKILGEIMGGLDEIPRILTLPDQGRFALGYYHQRQSFFARTESAINIQKDPQ